MEFSVPPLILKNHGFTIDIGSASSLLFNNLNTDETGEIILDMENYTLNGSIKKYQHFERGNTISRTIEEGTNTRTNTEEGTILSKTNIEEGTRTEEDNENKIQDKNIDQLSNEEVKETTESNNDVITNEELNKDILEIKEKNPIENIIKTNENKEIEDNNEDIGLYDVEFEGNDDYYENENRETNNNEKNGNEENESVMKDSNLIESMLLSESILEKTNEYQYFNNITSKMTKNFWSGSKTWKAPSTISKEKKKSEKKEKQYIDFETDPWEIEEEEFSITKASKDIELSKSTLEKRINKDNFLLPDDIHYELKDLIQPFSIPLKKRILTQKIFTKRTNHNNDYDNDDHDGIEYNGNDDENEYIETVNFIDPVLEEPNKEVNIEMLDDMNENQMSHMDLIKAPEQAKKLMINYSKRSTRVDVKKLKESLWDNLKQEEGDNEKGFAELIKEIQTNDNSKKEFHEISVPFCFICVLHLANEKNLEISGNEDFSNLIINLENKNNENF
jgi:condensin complex subunit 2